VNTLEDKKAENIVLLDLRPNGLQTDYAIADFFIICTGTSNRQIKALAENVRDALKMRTDKLPFSVEGEADSGWMLMDYGNIIIHIMGEEERRYYDLEGLWRNANVLLSIQ
jgi:ribosome-associated protein